MAADSRFWHDHRKGLPQFVEGHRGVTDGKRRILRAESARPRLLHEPDHRVRHCGCDIPHLVAERARHCEADSQEASARCQEVPDRPQRILDVEMVHTATIVTTSNGPAASTHGPSATDTLGTPAQRLVAPFRNAVSVSIPITWST